MPKHLTAEEHLARIRDWFDRYGHMDGARTGDLPDVWSQYFAYLLGRVEEIEASRRAGAEEA